MRNTIILTSGLTGSSVLTGTLTRAGYWPGDHTIQKRDYDTFENESLVKLNHELFQRAGFHFNYQTSFSQEAVDGIAALAQSIDLGPYRAFVRHCESRSPWIWKDPRLWMTIRFWHAAADLSACNFVLLTRDHFQCWVSTNSRRIIQSYRHTRAYELAIQDSLEAFVEENRLPYQRITYENLIMDPERTIPRLNRFLGASLQVSDLAAVYRGPLYQRPGSSLPGIVKAGLIYLKNYPQHVDTPQGKPLPSH